MNRTAELLGTGMQRIRGHKIPVDFEVPEAGDSSSG
jgi:hypothetical protein